MEGPIVAALDPASVGKLLDRLAEILRACVLEGASVGFVAPFVYFIFIILSTLRLDFWLSAFTGFVAGAELLGLALLHPAAQTAASDPTLAVPFVMSRSAVIFACGVIAGAVGTQLRRQFEASIAAATARDHVTNLFGQHVSPQVVERLLAAGPTAARTAGRRQGGCPVARPRWLPHKLGHIPIFPSVLARSPRKSGLGPGCKPDSPRADSPR